MKSAPASWLAIDPDAAAHQLDQLLADRQSETSAAVIPCRRPVSLRERPEDRRLFFRRDADAGVDDAEAQRSAVVFAQSCALDADDDVAPVGEFDRIAHEVAQYLTQ